jgi:hypothetical protein
LLLFALISKYFVFSWLIFNPSSFAFSFYLCYCQTEKCTLLFFFFRLQGYDTAASILYTLFNKNQVAWNFLSPEL